MTSLTFPSPFSPDLSTRAGRMMAAGRVKVTVTGKETGNHITVLLKCIADNRNRQYDAESMKNWIECDLGPCTHLFAEVPNESGWNDKIGTFYPKTGKWYDADNADPKRVTAAKMVAQWLTGDKQRENLFTFQEAAECGAPGCGRELTDPESIARGIGPVCYGKLTGSSHQKKGDTGGFFKQVSTQDVANLGPAIADFNEGHGVAGVQIGDEVLTNDDLRNISNSERLFADLHDEALGNLIRMAQEEFDRRTQTRRQETSDTSFMGR